MEILERLNSAEFTAEQKQYLLGFFAGAIERGARPFVGHTSTGLITDNPSAAVNQPELAEETYFRTPVSHLCREALWKHEQNPLDTWDRLIPHGAENRVP